MVIELLTSIFTIYSTWSYQFFRYLINIVQFVHVHTRENENYRHGKLVKMVDNLTSTQFLKCKKY